VLCRGLPFPFFPFFFGPSEGKGRTALATVGILLSPPPPFSVMGQGRIFLPSGFPFPPLFVLCRITRLEKMSKHNAAVSAQVFALSKPLFSSLFFSLRTAPPWTPGGYPLIKNPDKNVL